MKSECSDWRDGSVVKGGHALAEDQSSVLSTTWKLIALTHIILFSIL